RNTWSWGYPDHPRPSLRASADRVVGTGFRSGTLVLAGDGSPDLLFCDNETNTERLWGEPNAHPYPKDGINDHVVSGAATVNPDQVGTKAALRYRLTVPAGGRQVVRVRLVGTGGVPAEPVDVGAGFDELATARREEAEAYWRSVPPAGSSTEE